MTKEKNNTSLLYSPSPPVGKPVLKWAGGKQQLWKELSRHIPSQYGKYIEPFLGGGALFFGLAPEKAIVSDSNPELINLYSIIKNDLTRLIKELKNYQNNEDFYYHIRNLNPARLSDIRRAARILFLNKTCFNGLYRVNKKGRFNVPFGKYRNPKICDGMSLAKASDLLKRAQILEGDYKEVLKRYARKGDFIFLDPPYVPISEFSDFKRYTRDFFYEEQHLELADIIHWLLNKGCFVLHTNSNHPLVHKLFSTYNMQLHKTKRRINCKSAQRNGEDVIVIGFPKRKRSAKPEHFQAVNCEKPFQKFPSTRFMGSKQKLVGQLWDVASQFKFKRVLDMFSGSGVVSYLFKCKGKTVYSNDYMNFCSTTAKALVENSLETLSHEDTSLLLSGCNSNGFVSETFSKLYFSDDENHFIDTVLWQIRYLDNPYKQALAKTAIIRACLKRRPRGIFTYTGHRYDDGRKDLRLSLKEHFCNAIHELNCAVFDNNMKNKSSNKDCLEVDINADLVYLDPPYYTPHSDNEYTRRYHFVEGLSKNWEGLEIEHHTKTKKFKRYFSHFNTLDGTRDALERIFHRYRNSIILVSYSSNSLPNREELMSMIGKHKKSVEAYNISHTYSFGNQGHKVNDNNNRVNEYIFVGY